MRADALHRSKPTLNSRREHRSGGGGHHEPTSDAAHLLHLQRTVGNRATQSQLVASVARELDASSGQSLAPVVEEASGSTVEDLKTKITGGTITFDSDSLREELLGENKGTKVTSRLQTLALEVSRKSSIRISSIVRSEGHHGTGHAFDVGNETVASSLLPDFATDAKVTELGIDEIIFDAAVAGQSGRNVWNYDQGAKHDYDAATLNQHKNHIHFAVEAG